MEGASVTGLDGDEIPGETAELGVDLTSVLVRPGMPDGGTLGDGGDGSGSDRGGLDDRLRGLLGGLLVRRHGHGAPGETADQDQTKKESHKGIL